MKFPIFGLCASVNIRPLPGAWVAKLLGVQDHKKSNFCGHWQLKAFKGCFHKEKYIDKSYKIEWVKVLWESFSL